MPFAVRRLAALAILAAIAAAVLAQPNPKAKDDPKPKVDAKAEPPKEPTAEDVTALQTRFRAERADAVKARFPDDALAAADDLAKRADAALAASDFRSAARYYRDARWQLPYQPTNLPPHVVRVLGEGRMRHADRVNGVSYSPDGTRLASASRDGTVKVWDLGNGREVSAYRGHLDPADDPTRGLNPLNVADVAVSPDGKTVASAAGSQVHLWDTDTGKQLKVLVKLDKATHPFKAIAFRPDGKQLAVGGDDGILRVFEVESGKQVFAGNPRNARIEGVAFSPNGKLVAVVDSGPPTSPPGMVAVYAPGKPNPMPMSTHAVEYGEAFGVGFTPDSAAVFTAGKDGRVKLIGGPSPDGDSVPATTSKIREYLVPTAPGAAAQAIHAIAVTPDGKYLVSGGADKVVRVWEVGSGKPVRAFHGHLAPVTAVAVRADGRQVASASEDGAVRVWDLSPTDDHKAITDATDSVWAVAISPDGKRVAAAGADKTVRVYNPETGKLEVALPGHTSAVTSVAFFPDSNRLASVGGDRVLKLWDIAGRKAFDLPGHESAILAVAVADNGKLVVTGSFDRTVRGWDPDARKPVWTWTGKSPVCAVAIRKGGKHVAVGHADGTLSILDLSNPGGPREVATVGSAHVAGVACVAYGGDGNRAATVGGDGITKVWSVADDGTFTQLVKFDGQERAGGTTKFAPLSGVTFSPDGRLVATAGADAVVRVWDVQTKSEVRGLRGHTDWATAVAFSPDGRLLASAGVDKAVRVFEMTPQETPSQAGHLLAAVAVAVSPDGKTIATVGKDQTVKLWDRATGREIATLVGNADEPQALTFLGNTHVVEGTRSTSTGNGKALIWPTAPGRSPKAVVTGQVFTVVGAADGSRVGVCSIREGTPKVAVYEVFNKDGDLVVSLTDRERVIQAATFSADLAWLVSGDVSGGIEIWDVAKKERLGGNWPLFANPIADLAVTADRKLLVAADRPANRGGKTEESLIKVADVANRETLGSVRAHPGGVRGLVVSPTADTFITIGADRQVKAWSLADPKAVKEIRSWRIPAQVNGATYTPDGKFVVTANADGTAFVLELP